MQHEMITPIPLLDENGNLTEPGWARKPLPVYQRAAVKGGVGRLKEWDYYLVLNDHVALALTIADNAYMGLDSISLIDFDEGWEVTKSSMRALPMGRTGLPQSAAQGSTAVSGRGYGILFHNDGKVRTLTAHVDRFREGKALDAHIVLVDEPPESVTVCIPFAERAHFYCNQKINCMRASGQVTLGEKVYDFPLSTSRGTLDWGRGVWPYQSRWYWGSASGLLNDLPFGFNIGCGFGDTTAATENAILYCGRVHKLEDVAFQMPRHYMRPWRFYSSDGRFEMEFIPALDRSSFLSVGILKSVQHQIFGRYSGKAVLDDGTVLEVKDLLGFAERVDNRW